MHHFGVKLHAVKALFAVFHSRDWTGFGFTYYPESRGGDGNIVGVAHPAYVFFVYALENRRRSIVFYIALAVFAGFGVFDFAAERVRHKLRSVADAEYGNTEIEYFGVDMGRIFVVNAVGSARENNSFGIKRLDFVKRHIARE
ncbi:putative uncharacterized protein [Acidiphilium sp. CAG:727]|nr:putative uncharacterized protein [Acidiphilium sp. CAG:727]